MVKQKIVIKVSMEGGYSAGYLCCLMKLASMECTTKRSKALKIVVGFCGVISASLDGEDKIVVVGDGVDPVALTRMLRKRMHYAELISVEEKKDEEKEEKKEPTIWPYYYHAMQPYSYVVCS
ncbi:heavy metal-associated isoprenylated plant protein 16-like [Typha angustifolia]|uniref:heavy metal-associated isoprenylated plant protein 16-like n=1 Tax=Typha angustifolia TaxID=59011 RepID=UPI003C2EA6D4